MWKRGKNEITTNLRLLSVTAVSTIHCVALCNELIECHSAHFDEKRKACILTATWYLDAGISTEGFIFLEYNWNGKIGLPSYIPLYISTKMHQSIKI